ncbi:MAG: hypothetical protein ACE15C_05015 [Phycisphaerae bacterium]
MHVAFAAVASLALLAIGCAGASAPSPIRLAPATPPGTENGEQFAYGLSVTTPWADGGKLYLNFPEHLEFTEVGYGIARYSDKRPNAWVTERNGSYAHYEVDSLAGPGVSAPGVKVSATAEVVGPDRVRTTMTVVNGSGALKLEHVKPLLCAHYSFLAGFPPARGGADNFKHTYVVLNGKITAAYGLPVSKPEAERRGAAFKPYPPYRTQFATKAGGWADTPLDLGIVVITSADDERALILYSPDAESFLSNAFIPCVHADPHFGDINPGQSRTGTLWYIFAGADWRDTVSKLIAQHKKG